MNDFVTLLEADPVRDLELWAASKVVDFLMIPTILALSAVIVLIIAWRRDVHSEHQE